MADKQPVKELPVTEPSAAEQFDAEKPAAEQEVAEEQITEQQVATCPAAEPIPQQSDIKAMKILMGQIHQSFEGTIQHLYHEHQGRWLCLLENCGNGNPLTLRSLRDYNEHQNKEHNQRKTYGTFNIDITIIHAETKIPSPDLDISPLIRAVYEQIVKGYGQAKAPPRILKCFLCLVNNCEYYETDVTEQGLAAKIRKHMDQTHGKPEDKNKIRSLKLRIIYGDLKEIITKNGKCHLAPQTFRIPIFKPREKAVIPPVKSSEKAAMPQAESSQQKVLPGIESCQEKAPSQTESSQQGILPGAESIQKKVLPETEPSQQGVLPGIESTQQNVLPEIKFGKQEIPSGTESIQQKIVPEIKPSQQGVISRIKSTQQKVLPEIEPSQEGPATKTTPKPEKPIVTPTSSGTTPRKRRSDEWDKNPQPRPEAIFKCNSCGCRFEMLKNCQGHRQVYLKKDGFTCGRCKLSSQSQIRLPPLQNPPVCPFCNKENDLKEHLKTFHRVGFSGFLKCILCGKNYFEAAAFEEHLNNDHPTFIILD